MESLATLYTDLKSRGYSLEAYKQEDEEAVYEIFRHVMNSGGQFPFASDSKEEFLKQFLASNSHVYVCRHVIGAVIGGFYIKPNALVVHKSGSVANAAYMIREGYRGQGIGNLLVKASLYFAKELGFQGVQFNKVFIQNHAAIKLYQNLGFEIIASNQEACVMYRALEDI